MNSTEFYNCFFNFNLLNNKTADELSEITKAHPWFQLGWVLLLKNLKQQNAADYEKILKQTAARVSSRKLLFDFLNTTKNLADLPLDKTSSFLLQNENDAHNSDSGNSLIDQFLQSDQNTIRRKIPNESLSGNSHEDILKKSESEDDELITETLANIYLQQKNYEKAIHAFQKLSLKYPEKNIYFASRIKEVEDLKKIN